MPIDTNYGKDLIFDTTTLDFPNNFGETSGRNCLIQACIRRLTTPRGRLIDDPNYGFYIQDYLNDDVDARIVAQIGSSIDNELLKDERIIRSSSSVNYFQGILNIVISLVDANGPFRLILSVTSVTVSVLQAG